MLSIYVTRTESRHIKFNGRKKFKTNMSTYDSVKNCYDYVYANSECYEIQH